MASGALKALLGVLAVAGYQNRDKIAEILKGLRNPQQPGPDGKPQSGGGLGDILEGLTGNSGTGGSLGGLGGLFSGAAGGGIAGSLGELLRQFQQKGQGETADSWVKPGDNAPIDDTQLSEVLGPEILDDLVARTGLSREEILKRLSQELPTAVNDLTPDGQLPAEDGDDDSANGRAGHPSSRPDVI